MNIEEITQRARALRTERKTGGIIQKWGNLAVPVPEFFEVFVEAMDEKICPCVSCVDIV